MKVGLDFRTVRTARVTSTLCSNFILSKTSPVAKNRPHAVTPSLWNFNRSFILISQKCLPKIKLLADDSTGGRAFDHFLPQLHQGLSSWALNLLSFPTTVLDDDHCFFDTAILKNQELKKITFFIFKCATLKAHCSLLCKIFALLCKSIIVRIFQAIFSQICFFIENWATSPR